MSDYGHTEPRYLSDLRRSNCGRGLAPDGGVSANRAVTEPLQSGASPLPHLECVRLKNPVSSKAAALSLLIWNRPVNHAGRNSMLIWGVNRQGCRFSRPAPWMARGGGPPNQCRITGTPSLGICLIYGDQTVGGGLLPMAVCQPT